MTEPEKHCCITNSIILALCPSDSHGVGKLGIFNKNCLWYLFWFQYEQLDIEAMKY